MSIMSCTSQNISLLFHTFLLVLVLHFAISSHHHIGYCLVPNHGVAVRSRLVLEARPYSVFKQCRQPHSRPHRRPLGLQTELTGENTMSLQSDTSTRAHQLPRNIGPLPIGRLLFVHIIRSSWTPGHRDLRKHQRKEHHTEDYSSRCHRLASRGSGRSEPLRRAAVNAPKISHDTPMTSRAKSTLPSFLPRQPTLRQPMQGDHDDVDYFVAFTWLSVRASTLAKHPGTPSRRFSSSSSYSSLDASRGSPKSSHI
ncbi:hypothetical protein BKA63DRAFT_522098 [Paraphoma chrysanthemicola]|nr:hypothetical protein BKA63DRAFT_522098 [Paraphoma chrysanthemicola]